MLILDLLSIVAYVYSSQLILKRYKKYLVLFGFLYFSQAWALLSCFYNDLGTYNVELFRFTYPTLATFWLAVSYLVFNAGFAVAAMLLEKFPLARVDYRISLKALRVGNARAAVYLGIALLFVYLAYSLLAEGIPALVGSGRYEFFQSTDKVQRTLIIFGNLIAFVLGYFRRKQRPISASGLILGLFLIYAVLIGNKFSLLISLVAYYYVAIYVRYHSEHIGERLFRLKHGLLVLVSTVVIACFAFFTYALVIGDTNIAYNYLVNRTLTFQGEVWWAVDRDIAEHGVYDKSHGTTELENLIHRGSVAPEDVGMKYVMVKILGPEKAFPIIERGYLYTMAYPAILLTIFPYWFTLLIQAVAGAFLCLLLYYLYYSVLYGHAIRSIITMVVIIPYTTVLFTGNFAVFFTFGMAVKILILVILELGSIGARRKEVSA